MLVLVAFLPFSGEIFRVDMDPRSLAMGSASVSISDPVSSILINPANIKGDVGGAGMDFGLLYEGITGFFAGYRNAGKPYAFGIYSILSPSIELTTVPDTTRPPSQDNPPYVYATATYLASAIYLSMSFGRYYGISLKVLYQGIDRNRAVGFGSDIGFRWRQWGLVIRDFLPTVLFWNSGEREIIAPRIIVSGHRYIRRFLFVYGLDIATDSRTRDRLLSIGNYSIGIRGGVEYRYRIASFRAGYRNGKISMGFGVRYRNYRVDFATFYNASLGLNYRAGILYTF